MTDRLSQEGTEEILEQFFRPKPNKTTLAMLKRVKELEQVLSKKKRKYTKRKWFQKAKSLTIHITGDDDAKCISLVTDRGIEFFLPTAFNGVYIL
jgi:hypothetical protein